jgi:hypothetical protein
MEHQLSPWQDHAGLVIRDAACISLFSRVPKLPPAPRANAPRSTASGSARSLDILGPAETGARSLLVLCCHIGGSSRSLRRGSASDGQRLRSPHGPLALHRDCSSWRSGSRHCSFVGAVPLLANIHPIMTGVASGIIINSHPNSSIAVSAATRRTDG